MGARMKYWLYAGAAAVLSSSCAAAAETVLKSYEYYAGDYDREKGCTSLQASVDELTIREFRVHGCAFDAVDELPADNAAAALLAGARKAQLGQKASNAGGQTKQWVTLSALIAPRVVDPGAYVPSDFQCESAPDAVTLVTLEKNWEADGREASLGMSVSQLELRDGQWAITYERGFSVSESLQTPVIPCGD